MLPILQLLNADRPATARPPVRVLVLVPTRELALQVEESVRTYGARRPIRSAVIYGGVGFDAQVRAVRAGPEIVVATPGRLLDHLDHGHDRPVARRDPGPRRGRPDARHGLHPRHPARARQLLPRRRQTLLFSATFSDTMRELADDQLVDPATIEVARRNSPAELVRQVVHPVDRERKRELLSRLVRSGTIRQALVFTRTKHGANRLAEQLAHDGIAATAIHGNKSQPQRVRALTDFKAGRADILVATDIAARGLDIDALPHVVNYELPMVAEDYVHRIGRTGRAGADGIALSLVCVDEAPLLRDIEGLLGRRIETQVVDGFTPDRTIRPEPIRLRSGEVRGRPTGRSFGRSPSTALPGAARPGAARLGEAWPDAALSDAARPRVARADAGPAAGRPGASAGQSASTSRPAEAARAFDAQRSSGAARPFDAGRPAGGRPAPRHASVSAPNQRASSTRPGDARRSASTARPASVGAARPASVGIGRPRPPAGDGRARDRGPGTRGGDARPLPGVRASERPRGDDRPNRPDHGHAGSQRGARRDVAPVLVVERPPWARDSGRINGERVAPGAPRALPGERIAGIDGQR